MGKLERNEIQKTIEVLQEAVRAIEKLLYNERFDDVANLLVDCQECAIAIGTKMEKLYGADLETVRILEKFCEVLYEISLNMTDEIALEKQRELWALLKELKKVLPRELKKEAVFFPYKASMWDSLESVWMAAAEDDEYVTYVVPIPYFDRAPDGSVKEVYWEGEQFPDYVPITRYEDYDIEEHHPDMAFIHNPYDDANMVTSVHPDYYASKLKDQTDKLVYIPYFILDEAKPDDTAYVESKKHYVLTPGVIYADKVIVQSEDMRQIYVNVLTEVAGKDTRKMWEEKILGLGSPKTDKVLNTRKEDVEVPEEWLKVIQKPDGTWKKIIFYNTSLGALLHHEEKMLDKIERVLRTFEENQEDVALLWRPHPLYQSTIDAMRPEYGVRYQRIVENYRNAGWGIYDDTPDMNRAVALSDAYYGDHSSVARLYKQVGKLIMYQDPEVE